MDSSKSSSTMDRLVESLLEIVRKDGMESANVRAITRGADVTEATLYRYFPDKKSMFEEVWKKEAYVFLDALQKVIQPVGGAGNAELLSNYVQEHFSLYDANPAGYAYVFLSSAARKWRSADSRYQEFKGDLGRIFGSMNQSKSFDPLSAEMVRRIFISTIYFIPNSIESGQIEGPASRYAADIVTISMRLLGNVPSGE